MRKMRLTSVPSVRKKIMI